MGERGDALVASTEFRAESDGSGAFWFADLPLGTYSLSAQHGRMYGTAVGSLTRESPVEDVTLTLGIATPLGGMVVNPAGEPVGGGTLYPLLWNGTRLSRSTWFGLATEVDDHGAYFFPSLEQGAWSIYVTAPGYAPTLSPPLSAGCLDCRIQLLDGVSISGSVVMAPTMEPVADAVVSMETTGLDGPPVTVVCDSRGKFEFPALAPGDYGVRVQTLTANLALAETPLPLSVQGDPIYDLELKLYNGGSVDGRIYKEAGGEGLDGVRIEVTREGEMGALITTTLSGDDGIFSVEGLSSGKYVIRPRLPRDYLASEPKAIVVSVDAGKTSSNIDFAMKSGVAVRGRVLDGAGEAATGALVYWSGGGRPRRVTSDETGAYVIADVSPGDLLTLFAMDGDLASEPHGPIQVPVDGLTGIDLILTRARNAVIAGVLVDQNGRPLKGTVSALSEGPRPFEAPSARCDIDGRFAITGLAPDTYILWARYGNHKQQELRRLAVLPGQHIRDLRLVFQTGETISIAGQVLDMEGHGIQTSALLWRQEVEGRRGHSSVKTTIAGEFAFEDVPAGIYTVSASAPGHAEDAIGDIAEDTKGLELVLEQLPYIRGIVVDERNAPVTQFSIAAVPSGGDSPAGNTQSIYDSEGRFRVEVDIGRYDLWVRSPGFATRKHYVGAVGPGHPAEDIVVVLGEAERWRGRVISLSGRPVPGAAIFVGSMPLAPRIGQLEVAVVSEADGTFELPVPDGDAAPIVSAYHTDLGFGSTESPAGRETLLGDIVLYPTGALSVNVGVDAQTDAARYVNVSRGAYSITVSLGEDGTALAEGLSDGEVIVRLLDFEREASMQPAETVTIVPGEMTYITVPR